MREIGELLVNGRDARGHGLTWGHELNLGSLPMDRATVGVMDATEELDERRFSGPVFTDQSEHFSGSERQVKRFQCAQAGKGFFHAIKLEQHGWHGAERNDVISAGRYENTRFRIMARSFSRCAPYFCGSEEQEMSRL